MVEQSGTINQDTQLSSQEKVLIVDEDNNVVGEDIRKNVRSKNLWHRASYIFIQNSQGQFYVQKRSMLKDYCPGYFDIATGGVMGANETDLENAQRELEEEVGVKDIELKLLFQGKYLDDTNKVWGNVFGITWDGKMKLQEEEVESIHLMSKDEIFKRIKEGEKFTPDGIARFKEYIEFIK